MIMITKPSFIFKNDDEIETNFSERSLGIICALASSFTIGTTFVILRKIKSNPEITVHY